jgi:16S rRNA (guanine527-N7)-methyltransferase
MKANLSPDERAAVPADVEMFHVEQLEVPDLNETRCLVWLRPRLPADQTTRQPRQ